MLKHEYEFNCPCCGADLMLSLDFEGGKFQSLIYECGVCSKSLKITMEIDGDEVLFFSADENR